MIQRRSPRPFLVCGFVLGGLIGVAVGCGVCVCLVSGQIKGKRRQRRDFIFYFPPPNNNIYRGEQESKILAPLF